ncbi:fumarylacetoacetate hydrolase family protein [Natrarchaeobius halalkaliphilus]|uniref:Fumarylacetoacetate hydrolase family protein n=1 Tax=Natrarchaeobius halalkaliphilus TaxID=1679091 RepID=A0A3N6LYS6_9EURY|nr:fumarylacetoacetate hydrolase family protein [Natrarchaeobius halalkaliphilus]RQG87833.1 fumarylacetoacetate hydrolase family protein [Natrarchaeobius halalkaliphilus]
MKLATFEPPEEACLDQRVGCYDDDAETLVDVTAAYATLLANRGEQCPNEIARAHAPTDMIAFLERGERATDAAEEAIEFVRETGGGTGIDGRRLAYDLDEVSLLSPVPNPTSLRDYMVVEEHVRNALGDDIPEEWFELPVYYKADSNCIGHPDQDIEWPSYTEEMDYELELAAVIGKEGRDIAAENADEYIAGYTIYNDLSARDMQFREMEVNLGPSKGKDFNGSNVLGPFLVTPNSIRIDDVRMTARVNGEVWSEGTLGAMQHSFAEMIEHTSQSQYLYPGDVLGSGTIGMGCGLEMDRYLSRGDTVELEVEGIGTLRNRIVEL